MSNNIQTNNKDTFTESVRSKLHNFEMPVDEALWNGIQSAMVQPAKRKPVLIWFISGIAASVAVLLTISLSYFSESSSDNIAQVQKQTIVKPVAINVEKIKQVADKQSVISEINVKDIIESEIPAVVENVLTANTPNTQLEVQKPVENIIQNKENTNNVIAENDDFKMGNKDSAIVQQPKLLAMETPIPDWEDPMKEKSKSGITLLALASSAPGNSSAQSPLNAVSFVGKPRMGIMAAESASTYIFPAEFYESVDYKTPISVGIGISIPVLKHLSIETGVNYSYLLTQYNANLIDAQMNLHYIGIPCRMAYKFVDRPNWGMYSAAGATLEKGIWSSYQQNQHFTNSVITTNISKPIDGLQWSVQLSVGASINLTDKLAAYAEPKLGYYFANNQPASIRTNSALNVGLEAGIRWRIGN
jgi:hypothetical protein